MASLDILGTKHIAGGNFDDLSVLGVLNADEEVTCKELDILGKAFFEKKLIAKDIDILGVAEFKGDVKCENIDIVGVAKIMGNLDATTLDLVGILNIDGDVNVDKAEIATNKSSFSNIYGDKIRFVRPKHVKISSGDSIVTVNEIDATTIVLRDVRVKKVSGEDIKILDGVEVDVVEYSKSLSISKNAKIGKIIKF